MAELMANLINYIGSLGPYAQMAVGTAAGCIIGLSLIKISKFAAAVLGGAIILIKIAENEDWIHIDWAQMQQNVHNISTKPFNNLSLPAAQEIPAKIQNFIISLIGGALIGIGCA